MAEAVFSNYSISSEFELLELKVFLFEFSHF
jgi:hypothetical protein